MEIRGIDNLSVNDVSELVERGGRFVTFSYAISILVMTFKRSSSIHFIKPGEGTFVKSLPYTLLSLVLGWWGIPWGFIYTPWAVIENLSGGRNVTAEVMNAMGYAREAAYAPATLSQG